MARLAQDAAPLDRALVAGTLWSRGDGRSASGGGSALRRLESGAARLVESAEQWPWSSARAHLAGRDDRLVCVAPLLERIGDFAEFLGGHKDQLATRALRVAETTGRPVGSASWVGELEARSGRSLARKKRGPKIKAIAESIS